MGSRSRNPRRPRSFAAELIGLLDDPGCDVFFGDKAGFEGDPRPRQKWVRRGSRPTRGYFGGHVRQNVVGAVNPANGQLVSLIVPHCATEVFQSLLDTIAAEAAPEKGRRTLLVLDNAAWHKAKRLRWHHIGPLYLPPYRPGPQSHRTALAAPQGTSPRGLHHQVRRGTQRQAFRGDTLSAEKPRKPSARCAAPIRNNVNHFWQRV